MASSTRLLLPPLPFELIEEILYRTPAESLIRFKSTCKKWYDLITNNKMFIYNHLNHSPERFLRINTNKTVQIMDPVTTIIRSYPPIPDDDVSNMILSMVHCDGLMLCLCDDRRKNNNGYARPEYADLAVWNPLMRQIKWVEPSVYYWQSDHFGLGYNNACRDNYKILRFRGPFVYCFNNDDDDETDPECEIYEFKSDSWRTLNAKFDWKAYFDYKGVSVKGNMYWIAIKDESFIISFDFSKETFNDICVCPPYRKTRRLGCFNGDRLSLLLQDDEEVSTEIEVWMTNKLSDGVVSFTKYFNVATCKYPILNTA